MKDVVALAHIASSRARASVVTVGATSGDAGGGDEDGETVGEGVDTIVGTTVEYTVGEAEGGNTGSGGHVLGCGSGSASACQVSQRSAAQKLDDEQLQYCPVESQVPM
eukprot:CAMPEP_0114426890 /NCGR_PEP_ID=MMETSP0103-20121206/8048_1 /TAXON_ID=37642 ORGANISM="Paraphysomonas imperforata, Strain PA2" /NCGR_SAMPLE_ID=MMETSP0103 /ASSEMBLY_ACC=CAM_ASM_000201 /LENGTH=107 /DNA_ID=CAMNT_0001595899 /DNA_START=48 /DNA_END=372 /DNA_ORIENTATION=+